MLPDKAQWLSNFVESTKYKEIVYEVEKLRGDVFFTFEPTISNSTNWSDSPRYKQLRSGIINLQPFYILEYISSMNNGKIYDIGCGYNFFKKFYNIVGIDPLDINADIQDEFNDNFVKKNNLSLDNIFSINAIHFCKLLDLEERISNFFSLVRPNGNAYLAINIERVFDNTFKDYQGASKTLLNKLYPNGLALGIDESIKKILDSNVYEVILYENLIEQYRNEIVDGNLRILIKRKK